MKIAVLLQYLQADDKLEPWRPKTWPQKGSYKPTTNLNPGDRKPGPKKAIGVTCHKLGYIIYF
jgi:hypothetical protein